MKEIICPNCHSKFSINEEEFKSIRLQLRDQDFNDELAKREQAFEQSKQDAVKIAEAALATKAQNKLAEKDAEIAGLKAQLNTKETAQELAIKNAVAEKDQEIVRLLAQINSKATEQELAVKNAVSAKEEELNQKTIEIERLKGQIDSQKKETELEQNNLKAGYEQQLKLKDEEIERIKDFKSKQSTKMVGESLEQYCKNEFEKVHAMGFRNATYIKDTKNSDTGSKGDFIFREAADGVEFISIMFEMKNKMDTTATKQKNEDFFKELDKDRREKNCEYAVLVTLLEPDNDLYNRGIVDVSYNYEKMYVIRPQFFVPMISLLRNAAMNSLQCRKELIEAQNQNIDIANFEAQLIEFKQKFDNDCRMAGNSFQKAIDDIDKTIKKLEDIKESLQLTVKHMAQGNKKLQNVTIKKFVKDNPTMAAKFAELKKEQDVEE